MASLKGTYESPFGDILQITSASNGQLIGQMKSSDGSFQVDGFFNTFPGTKNTCLTINARREAVPAGNPAIYEIWAGTADSGTYNTLTVRGGKSIIQPGQQPSVKESPVTAFNRQLGS